MPVHSATDPDLFELAALSHEDLVAATSGALGIDVMIDEVAVSSFPYNWGAVSTAGLWRVDVSGSSRAGPASYSFFVKLLQHPRHWCHIELVPAGPARERFLRQLPWRAELDMHECGIAGILPPGLRAARLHAVSRADDDHVALWSEFVDSRGGEWTIGEYADAARLLGRLAARRRLGDPVNEHLPTYCRVSPKDGALRYYAQGRVLMGVVPQLREGVIWRHPVLSAALAEVDDAALPEDMVRLADRLPDILDLLETLPQTHAHGDASPQNLLIPLDAPASRVIIDWGFGTPLPVGFDLGQLLVGLANDRVCAVDELPAIFDATLAAYTRGLADDGYVESLDTVRTGFVGSVAVRTGLVALPFELLSQPGAEKHHDLFVNQLRLTRYLLDLAETL